MQDCSNSIANALELLQSHTKPSICITWPQFFPKWKVNRSVIQQLLDFPQKHSPMFTISCNLIVFILGSQVTVLCGPVLVYDHMVAMFPFVLIQHVMQCYDLPETGLDIKYLVYMPVGHMVLKIYLPCKNFHVPSQYLYKPCKAYIYCWENNYMPRLKNHLPSRARKHRILCALGQDLCALGMRARLNVEPCEILTHWSLRKVISYYKCKFPIYWVEEHRAARRTCF